MLWRTATRDGRNESIHQNPLCSNTSCHMVLEQKDKGYFCKKCDKQYSILGDYYTIVDEVNRSWKGSKSVFARPCPH